VSERETILDTDMQGISVAWKGSLRCDISVKSAGRSYRIYFAPPVRGVPRLDKASVDKIGATIQQSSKAGRIAGYALGTSAIMGDYLAIGRLVTEAIDLYRTVSDVRVGKKSANAFRGALSNVENRSDIR